MNYGDNNDRIASGRTAELKFKEWLDNHKIPYLYIQQDSETFSTAFKDNFSDGKRPDFMILIPHFGFIFVDVKYRKANKLYGTFPIDWVETKRYSSFQRKFNLQVWYAFSNDDVNYNTWFWIPVSKVLESENRIDIQTSSKSNQTFLPIPVNSFTQIAHDDSLDRLFSKSFG